MEVWEGNDLFESEITCNIQEFSSAEAAADRSPGLQVLRHLLHNELRQRTKSQEGKTLTSSLSKSGVHVFKTDTGEKKGSFCHAHFALKKRQKQEQQNCVCSRAPLWIIYGFVAEHIFFSASFTKCDAGRLAAQLFPLYIPHSVPHLQTFMFLIPIVSPSIFLSLKRLLALSAVLRPLRRFRALHLSLLPLPPLSKM